MLVNKDNQMQCLENRTQMTNCSYHVDFRNMTNT